MKKSIYIAALLVMLAGIVLAEVTNISDYAGSSRYYTSGETMNPGAVAASDTFRIDEGRTVWITVPFAAITDTCVVDVGQSIDGTYFSEAVRDTLTTTDTWHYLLENMDVCRYFTVTLSAAGADTSVAGPVNIKATR
jgi:hypothetical protein